MRAHAPYPERLSRNSHHILFFTPMITKGDWKEGKKKGREKLLFQTFLGVGFLFPFSCFCRGAHSRGLSP